MNATGTWSVDPGDTSIVLDAKKRPKCEVYGDGADERREHARWISATPELLAALKAAAALLPLACTCNHTDRCAVCTCEGQIEAAIAKAGGQQ